VARSLQQHAWTTRQGTARLEQALPDLEAGRTTPYEVAAAIVAETLRT